MTREGWCDPHFQGSQPEPQGMREDVGRMRRYAPSTPTQSSMLKDCTALTHLEEEGALPRLLVKLLCHAVPRPPDLDCSRTAGCAQNIQSTQCQNISASLLRDVKVCNPASTTMRVHTAFCCARSCACTAHKPDSTPSIPDLAPAFASHNLYQHVMHAKHPWSSSSRQH
jgi:hypothetical protein